MQLNSDKKIKALLLSAGIGTRLRPLTELWPKCLMPIHRRPILEYWLETVRSLEIKDVLVNTHYKFEIVQNFLRRPSLEKWVNYSYESELQGTAGSLRLNYDFFKGASTTLLIHADNWCQFDLDAFVYHHNFLRPKECPITMMTFATATPESCGIVKVDKNGVVTAFYEKSIEPHGNRANGAVYLLEPEVIEWVASNPEIKDFSTQVIQHYVGRIYAWHNEGIFRDIGSIETLLAAQGDPMPISNRADSILNVDDEWIRIFNLHPIHKLINQQIIIK